MHVGLLTTSFPLPGNPASGIFVARLAEYLSREISLTVLTPAGVDTPPQAPGNGYSVRCFRYAPRRLQRMAHQPGGIPVALRNHRWLLSLLPLFLLGMFIACWRLARDVDLLHANWTATGAIAGLAGMLAATPAVTTLRGSDVERLQRSPIERMLLRVCARTNARLVCVSEAIAEQVATILPGARDKISVIPNGVDDRFLQIRREPGESGGRRLSLLMVGSLIPRKAPRLAVEALRQLAGRSNAKLLVVGDGPERASLVGMVETFGLRDRVGFEGQLPPEQIPELLSRCNALVLTSRFEGRPNVVLEAMAAGLPVLATRIPGVTEIVEDEVTGLLFEPDDAGALAECILRLERDPELGMRLGAAGRRFILEHGLLWERTARRYIDVYRSAFGGSRG